MDSLLDQSGDQPVDENKDYFSELVGEGKKYKSEKDLAKAYYHADSSLRQREVAMDQLRADFLKEREQNVARGKLEELLDRLEKTQKPIPENKTDVVEQKTPSIDKREIESLIDNRMSERDSIRKQTENQNFVKQKLVEHFGQNYSSKLAEQMAELDISEDYLNNAARHNPKALLKMLGVDSAPINRDPFRTPPRNAQNTFSYGPKKEVRNWDWYQKLKKEDPKTYYDPKTNVQMMNDAQDLGDAFETDDFRKHNKDYRIKY